jgi:hypothetical protein
MAQIRQERTLVARVEFGEGAAIAQRHPGHDGVLLDAGVLHCHHPHRTKLMTRY